MTEPRRTPSPTAALWLVRIAAGLALAACALIVAIVVSGGWRP